MTAIWNGTLLAEHDEVVVVEGTDYFPPDRDAAWHRPGPSAAAQRITGHVAFRHGVRVERSGPASAGGQRMGFVQRLLGAKVGATWS